MMEHTGIPVYQAELSLKLTSVNTYTPVPSALFLFVHGNSLFQIKATKLLLDKEAPSIAVAMTTKSLAVTSMAMLSR